VKPISDRFSPLLERWNRSAAFDARESKPENATNPSGRFSPATGLAANFRAKAKGPSIDPERLILHLTSEPPNAFGIVLIKRWGVRLSPLPRMIAH